jgi:hypothetical protein
MADFKVQSMTTANLDDGQFLETRARKRDDSKEQKVR